MDSSLPASRVLAPKHEVPPPEVSIIIPARNEESNLGACLQLLTSQTGVTFEIIVVDDGSTDRTRPIAESFAGVKVISPQPLPSCWTGKNNAVIAGADTAKGNWLLFTDADTVHLPGSLARALAEAKNHQADLLSYSPAQIVVTFAERAAMPVIFAELAAKYPPHKVRDQNSGIAAANGQYILVRRTAYEAVGGHAAVAGEILEDVALAQLFRNAGCKIRFRYGADAVRTRMYRNWAQLQEGWIKNLAQLFPQPTRLALQSVLVWIAAWAGIAAAAYGAMDQRWPMIALAVAWLLVYRRIRAANFAIINNLIAIAAGLPIFSYLLLRSKKAHEMGRLSWKGREYTVSGRRRKVGSSPGVKPLSTIDNPRLRTEN